MLLRLCCSIGARKRDSEYRVSCLAETETCLRVLEAWHVCLLGGQKSCTVWCVKESTLLDVLHPPARLAAARCEECMQAMSDSAVLLKAHSYTDQKAHPLEGQQRKTPTAASPSSIKKFTEIELG